jgi:hypothetical protein
MEKKSHNSLTDNKIHPKKCLALALKPARNPCNESGRLGFGIKLSQKRALNVLGKT